MDIVSDCCNAAPWGEEEMGICGSCKEHCDFIDLDEEEDTAADRGRD